MKFFLKMVFAVFIGNLSSLYVMEVWRSAQTQRAEELEKNKLAEQKRMRDEQGAKIRQLLLNAHQQKGDASINDGGMPEPSGEVSPNSQ